MLLFFLLSIDFGVGRENRLIFNAKMRHTQCSVTKKKEEKIESEGKPIMKFSNY